MPPRIEVLRVCESLVHGDRQDRSAPVVARALRSIGLPPARVVTTGAGSLEARAALAEAVGRGSVVVVLGAGLPGGGSAVTDAAASVAGVSLEAAAEGGAPVPLGASPLASAVGGPAGFTIEVDGCRVFGLPGEGAHLEAMLEASVLPALGDLAEAPLSTTVLSTFGLDGAEVEERLADLADSGVSVRDRFPEVLVDVRARGAGLRAADAAGTALAQQIIERLGAEVVHGVHGETLGEAAVSALGAVGATVAVAESMSPGLLAGRLGAGASPAAPLVFAISTPTDHGIEEFLAVERSVIARRGVVSVEVAEAMATGVRRLSGADLGLAVTGISGPASGGPDQPVGLVCFALAAERGSRSVERRLGPGAPWRVEELAAATALDLVVRWCRGVKG